MDNNVKLSIYLILFTLLIASSYFFVRLWFLRNESNYKNNTESSLVGGTWKDYRNSLVGFTIKFPPSLVVRDLGGGSIYYNFVRFEEVSLEGDKGIGVGVRKADLTSEVERIKSDFAQDKNAKLSSQKKVEVDGSNGVRLYYKPKEDDGSEERVVVIFSKGDFVYSISTVPSQIDEVLANFKFTN